MSQSQIQDPQLVRLQILTPLSVLLSLGANLVGTLAIKPGAGQISDEYETILTPRKSLVGFYWLVLFVLQIGYSLLLVIARKAETKATIVHGVGIRFPLANLAFALWPIFWDLKVFVASEICLLISFALILSVWATLFRYPATTSRPLDFLFIHAPITMFVSILWNLDLWHNGLLAFNWFKYLGSDPDQGSGRWERDHENHAWIVFGVITAVGLISSFVVFLRRDFVWAASTIYLFIAVLLKGDKPAQIFVPLVVLSVLQLVAIVASALWYRYGNAREGAIALPDDEASPEQHIVSDQERAGFSTNVN